MDVDLSIIFAGFVCIAAGSVMAWPCLLTNVRIAPQLALVDWPKARGMVREQIPIVGYSLVLLTIGIMVALWYLRELSPWFLFTALMVAVMGHFDDRRPLAPHDKFFWQLVCATIVVVADPHLNAAITEKFGTYGVFWAIFFILGLMNATNFIDGIDGLAGSMIFVGALGVAMLCGGMVAYQNYFAASLLIAGMMLPFLYINVVSRRGFLGNLGSYFFSFVLAVMHLSIPLEFQYSLSRVSLSALCFVVPLADASMVIFSRSFTLRSPFHSDKGHLHHRLIQCSIPLRYVLLCFLLIAFSGLTFAAIFRADPAFQSSIFPFVACLTLAGVSSLLIVLIEKASKWRVKSYVNRLDSEEPIFFLKYRLRTPHGGPISKRVLLRLEARISAEIRVSDICYTEGADRLFVVLKSIREPLERITGRLEHHFVVEGLKGSVLEEQSEFLKVSDRKKRKPAPGTRSKLKKVS